MNKLTNVIIKSRYLVTRLLADIDFIKAAQSKENLETISKPDSLIFGFRSYVTNSTNKDAGDLFTFPDGNLINHPEENV